jgi:hypothetical protein
MIACATACVQASSIDCGFGVCPADRVCDGVHELCVKDEQLHSCIGKPDNEPCSVSGRPGLCTDEVCLENYCGDGVVTGTEQCDGDAFVDDAHDCLNVGFYDSGPISCNPDCTIDTTLCARTCGDMTKDAEEACEFSMSGQDSTCGDRGYYEDASAPCTAFCTYDISACHTRCGDGVVNGPEVCEPALGLPPYLSCVDYGFDSGVATCGGTCNADLAACHHFGVVTAGGLSMSAQDVWQAAPSLAFVVGSEFSNAGPRGLIARWNGTQLEPVAPASGRPFYGVTGTSPTNIFAVGQVGRIARFDGVTITDMTSPTTADLLFVYALDATHVYAAGTGGVILQYDGSAWTAMTSGTANPLNAIWASGPSDVWAVGVNGTIRHYNGSTWSASTSNTPQSLSGVWGTGPTDVWAVGSTGTILHYNGTSWSLMQQPANLSFFSVWGGGPDDVLAVTEDAMLHYDGTHWVRIDEALAGVRDVRVFDHSHGVLLTLDGRILRWDGEGSTALAALGGFGLDIWGTSAQNLYATSVSGIWRFNGVVWGNVDATVGETIWGTSANDVFVGGQTMRHFNGSTWSTMSVPPEITGAVIRDLWGFDSQDVYAVTDFGDILHYDGQWTRISDDPDDNVLSSIWGASPQDLWAIGGGIMLHGDGTTWDVVEINGLHSYGAIWGTASDDIYLVGAAGVARHFDGTTWTPIALGTQTRDLTTIHGTSANDVFIGGAGTLQHFDGTTWAPITTGVDTGSRDTVAAVWASLHDIAVLGQDATAHFIVRACPTCL